MNRLILLLILFVALKANSQVFNMDGFKKILKSKTTQDLEGFYKLDSLGRGYIVAVVRTGEATHKIYYVNGELKKWTLGNLKGILQKEGGIYSLLWNGYEPNSQLQKVHSVKVSNNKLISIIYDEGDFPDNLYKVSINDPSLNYWTGTDASIKMIKSPSGIFEIPAQINEVLKIYFIIDTGASEVSISSDIALTLIKTKTINEADWLPGKFFKLADGSVAKSERFIIRQLQIGNHQLRNIECSISASIEAPMLLGQNALKQLGIIQIDYNSGELKILKD